MGEPNYGRATAYPTYGMQSTVSGYNPYPQKKIKKEKASVLLVRRRLR